MSARPFQDNSKDKRDNGQRKDTKCFNSQLIPAESFSQVRSTHPIGDDAPTDKGERYWNENEEGNERRSH
jgi:hypothetical protein